MSSRNQVRIPDLGYNHWQMIFRYLKDGSSPKKYLLSWHSFPSKLWVFLWKACCLCTISGLCYFNLWGLYMSTELWNLPKHGTYQTPISLWMKVTSLLLTCMTYCNNFINELTIPSMISINFKWWVSFQSAYAVISCVCVTLKATFV